MAKPTGAAMRAAAEVMGHPYIGALTLTEVGGIIDRSTGLPELIAAAERALQHLDACCQNSSNLSRIRAADELRSALAATKGSQ